MARLALCALSMLWCLCSSGCDAGQEFEEVMLASTVGGACPDGTKQYGAYRVLGDDSERCLEWEQAALCVRLRSAALTEAACWLHVETGAVFAFHEVPGALPQSDEWMRNRAADYDCFALPHCAGSMSP